jgi:hypothetical protein
MLERAARWRSRDSQSAVVRVKKINPTAAIVNRGWAIQHVRGRQSQVARARLNQPTAGAS